MDVIVIFHFELYFALLPPNSPKNQNFIKNEKKNNKKKKLEISSFYTIAPKTMIICYTVAEIWRVADVIVIFHFGLLISLLPL